ncbi:MAG: N-methyl-L-tryptophan oxidase [Planctomycetaceae bacterium]|jgi:sarcosine oxidase|nr:N-methyl-L-tryptophan oxidase [Planctomycetaceae bacterium]MBT4846641.1 N-methyl-L-tryptophan oxidase [Planctomycetaceae bacterium]MBT5124396.1 N-methyl-L-tryptophan oxidase [Planctomycetaceae bacterium]MBT5597324.1 N-methyl-L-tryptophan oxidase [Planctomycetaceae bacterium]MBT5884339.1 N-methyl-L-tryptophan oxidase [Planctomycetaceae bacterium]
MSNSQHFDCLVLGTGGIGSAALYHLAKQGKRVAGIDRFGVAHDRGSSHGQTRIIRQSYFEHPSYVPLVQRAFELWEELQAEHGRDLYYQTGILQAGPGGGALIQGVLASSAEHGLPIEHLNVAEARKRWPQFAFDDDMEVVFEQRGGFLLIEHAISAHIEKAQWAGAELFVGHTICEVKTGGRCLEVLTDQGTFTADSIVVTAGAWAADLLPELKGHLRILNKPLHWYTADADLYSNRVGCPVFFFESETGDYYGFPSIDERGLKLARHSGGAEVSNPLELNRSLDEDERSDVAGFLRKHLPQVSDQATDHAVCMYTVTSDSHFIIDRAELDDRIVYAAGLSGHGFKFAAALGELLAKMANGESHGYDLAQFSARPRIGTRHN